MTDSKSSKKRTKKADASQSQQPLQVPSFGVQMPQTPPVLPPVPQMFATYGGNSAPMAPPTVVGQQAGVSADTPIALVCSDIHLSPAPPAARIEEPDWLKAMETQMHWLFQQAKTYAVPIVIAGDVFHKAVEDSRFISFVIRVFSQSEMPIYAVAGNHDLPYHSYDNMGESAYGILLAAGVLKNLESTMTLYEAGSSRMVMLHGYQWGRPLSDPPPFDPSYINVAVFHKFIYESASGFKGADPDGMYENLVRDIRYPYDFLIFGDNHTPFTTITSQGGVLINCGSFFRRSQNDRLLKPAAYLLKANHTFETLYVPLDGQTFLQETNDPVVNQADYSELAAFFTEGDDLVDNLTVRDSFVRFVAAAQSNANVKQHLSKITGMSFI